MGELFGIVLGVFVLLMILTLPDKCAMIEGREKCNAQCGVLQGKMIDDKCHCKTETGWQLKELGK